MINSRLIAFTMWLMASTFYAYQYVLRVMPSILMNDIMQNFKIDAAIFGQFSGVYYLGYALMHLPIGIMIDRYGPRKIMTACIVLTIIGLLPIIFAKHWIYPIVGRTLIGIGSSAAILCAFKIIRICFNEKHFSRMLSFCVTIGLLGAIYGGVPISYMNEAFGYQNVIKIFAAIGLGLAIITYLIVPEIENENKATVFNEILEVITNKKVILVCICAGLMVGPIEGFADVWGTSFFKNVYLVDNNIAASLPSTIFIGMCFGAPLLSYIAERTNNYYGTIISSGAIMALIFIAILTAKLNNFAISLSLTIVGICCAYQILAIYKASTYVPENAVGLTTAIANMIIMVFGYLFHSVIGYVVNNFLSSGASKAYSYGISVFPITLAIGSLGFVAIAIHDKKKYNKKLS